MSGGAAGFVEAVAVYQRRQVRGDDNGLIRKQLSLLQVSRIQRGDKYLMFQLFRCVHAWMLILNMRREQTFSAKKSGKPAQDQNHALAQAH
jgi:hypothetical protein